MSEIRTFRDLKVWQKSHSFVLKIYGITKQFPDDERFGLISQMRRASVSIPANIDEGFRRRGKRDKANYYNIAQGSLDEMIYYLILTEDLGYIDDGKALISEAEEILRMLSGLLNNLK